MIRSFTLGFPSPASTSDPIGAVLKNIKINTNDPDL